MLWYNLILLACSVIFFSLEYAAYRRNHELLVNRRVLLGKKYFLKIGDDDEMTLYCGQEVYDRIIQAEEKGVTYRMHGENGDYVYNRITGRLRDI